jgi:Zn-finger nucleic acid-binding protein
LASPNPVQEQKDAEMKNCPICKIQLNRTLLDKNLPAYKCSNCDGIWISSNEYLSWLSPYNILSVEEIDIDRDFDTPYPKSDHDQAILCPDCGRFLRRFEIWPNIEFYLDRCSTCNGIWFDRNEWQTLQSQNLHNKVNMFFTEAWQAKLRNEEMRQRFEEMFLELFGQADYQKIKEIRAWLTQNPNGDRLLAYLTDRDPYKG